MIGHYCWVIEPVPHIDLISTPSNIDHTCLDQSGLHLLVFHSNSKNKKNTAFIQHTKVKGHLHYRIFMIEKLERKVQIFH